MVFVQKSNFFFFVFFLEKSGQKRLVFDILEKIGRFLDQKNKLLKSANHRHFPKGIIHGFCPNIKLFLIYFFGGKQVCKDHFLIFWIGKNHFLTGKLTFQKVPKNTHFPGGIIHGFLLKNRTSFQMCFFAIMKSEKMVF